MRTNKRRFISAGGLWSLSLALPAALLAQSPPAVNRTVVQDHLVVTAALEESRQGDLPASVEVIGAAEIEARQATSIAELLATATGLHIVQSGSAGMATSLFSRGTESDHTSVLWNGVELNNPYFGGFDWAFMPTEGVERVEIVRGPFSALHGSDALGGAVQIISRRDNGGAARLEVGERGYSRAAINLGADLARARLDVAGHLRQGDGLATNDFYDSSELVASLEWSLGEDSTIGVVTRVNDSEIGIPRSSGLPSPSRRIDWQERQVAVPYSRQMGKWSLDAQWSTVTLDSAFRDPDDAFGFTSSDTRSEAGRLRAQAGYNSGSGSWIALGAETERLEVDDRSVFGVSLDGERQQTDSLFAQALHKFSSFTVDAGARYDDSDVYGSRLTPRFGVVVPLSPAVSLRAAYGEGFRAPSLGELFFQFSGNPALEPEESESLEVGVEYRSQRWLFEVVGFDNQLTNLIDFDFDTFTNVNVGRARTRGFEGSVAFAGDRTDFRANATVLEARDELANLPLLRRPEESASLVVTRRMAASSYALTASYVGDRPDVDPVTFGRAVNEAYFKLDLAGEYRGFDRWRPYARLENALDESYQEALGFPAVPRSLIGGLSIHWQ